MLKNPRIRAVLGAGTALAVVAGIGIAVASSSNAATPRYVTATAGTGDVTQTYVATGSITRKNTSVASFSVSGTVKKVAVAVGDEVEAGDVLAVLDKGKLQLAVLNAETSVARAKASLYSAQHPATTASSGGSAPSGGNGSGTGITIDPKLLNQAVSRINLAILDEADKCNAIFSSILPAAEPTPTASATPTPSAGPTPTGTATATPTPTATTGSEAKATPTAKDTASTATTDDNPVATAGASQLAKVLAEGDFTDDQLQACANARAEVILANTNLQTVVAQLTRPRPGGSTKKSSSSSKSSSSGSVSKSAVASAEADLLQAEQDLAGAQADLEAAELVAPISGTVGLVDYTAGTSSSGGSITIVGSGSAVVSFELPLATLQLVRTGDPVTVTPAGSTKALSGRITGISSLETSGTAGDTPTYATEVSVGDADGLLATGAKASVLIPVKAVSGVLRVPASAVTPTGTGAATVQVVDDATASTATTVQVKTGAVGGGWVQITEGLEAGRLVVLADTTAEIPSNQSNFRRTTTASSSSRSSTTATSAPSAPATASATTQAAQPTSTAGR